MTTTTTAVNDFAATSPVASRRPFAIVTGASSGIGFELARRCADGGYDLLIAADSADVDDVAARLRRNGTVVEAIAQRPGRRGGSAVVWRWRRSLLRLGSLDRAHDCLTVSR
jgi:NAD(P)-dependent dehydrogenase (short-subunit alcohol dehydrogenase family)